MDVYEWLLTVTVDAGFLCLEGDFAYFYQPTYRDVSPASPIFVPKTLLSSLKPVLNRSMTMSKQDIVILDMSRLLLNWKS